MNDPIVRERIVHQPTSFYLKQSREGGETHLCGKNVTIISLFNI